MKHQKSLSIIIGIIGLWSAGFIAIGITDWQLSMLPPIDCSGMNPCRNEEYTAYAIGCSIASFLGAVGITSSTQYVLKKHVVFRISLLYGIIGIVLWPFVGILILFLTLIPAEILSDIPALFEYRSMLSLGFALALCGAGIGFVVFKLLESRTEEDKNENAYDHPKTNLQTQYKRK